MLASPAMKRWENVMRVGFLALSAGLILASLPTASDAQRADNDIFPRSIALQQEGHQAQETGDLDLAIDFYESALAADRSEEHTSELQSLMRISYAVFCLTKKNIHNTTHT